MPFLRALYNLLYELCISEIMYRITMFRSKNYFKKRIILHYRFIIDIRMDGYIYIRIPEY